MQFFVPVVNHQQEPLMPTTLLRARRWIISGKATPFYKKGMFCVRLNVVPSNNQKQRIAVGIDPGSKREAFTVKSASYTYCNILTEAVDWVKDAVERRRNARKARRFRKTRYREARFDNRHKSKLPPSTKARWQWKLRIVNWLIKMFPVTDIAVEDIKAETTGKKRWDVIFSPLEVGKQWFYDQLEAMDSIKLHIYQGYETKQLRDDLELKKSSSKLADKFECHNVDSWVLANNIVGGHQVPDNVSVVKIIPLQFHRRQLHMFQPSRGNIRKTYGGTRSMGLKRGSIVKHNKYGICYVGGTSHNRISLHCLGTGKRLTQGAKIIDIWFRSYGNWRIRKVGVSSIATEVA